MSGKQHVLEFPRRWDIWVALNGRLHRPALMALTALVIGHWGEHLVQAWQIWGLHWPRERSLGLLGMAFPWLVKSEQLHYWIALVMLLALLVLRPAFTGPARAWWDAALWIQVWHHLEHLLLFGQVLLGVYLLGRPVQTQSPSPCPPAGGAAPRLQRTRDGAHGYRCLPACTAPPADGYGAALYLLTPAAAAMRRLSTCGDRL